MPKETDRLKLPLPLGNENVTRESINGIFEKIDAGVATRESILISAESDLNSYITEGEYYCPTNATVETLANSPVGVAFHLTIERHAGVVQTLTTFEPSNLQVFQRNYYVGWGPWKKVPTRDDIEEVKVYTDQKVGEIVIDDASLTDKGIVQLSNAVDGTREDLAATEKAVREARVAAETNAATNAKSYTDGQVNQISNSLNLFSAAVRSIDNIFVCAFNRSLMVTNGLSFKIQFNTTNSSVNLPTYLQINDTNYQLRVEQFKNYTLPNNLIDTSKIYEVKYNSNLGVFLLMDSFNDADLRSSEITIIVGKSDANAQFTTIQSAVNYLKKFNAGRRSIRIKNTSNSVNFTENVIVREFHGGPLFFLFDPGIKLNGYFSIDDCSAEVFINGNYEKPLEIINSNGGVSAQNCYKLTLYFVNKVSAGLSFLSATGVLSVYVSSCVCSNQYIPFEFNRGCLAYLENVSGTGNERVGRAEGALITMKNVTLTNSTFTVSGGAQVFK
ncbi:tail fiber protein [Paenibacillus sp. O199]|uniref:tail fiber protein n=1 Tax=Paenibacillus sp. O199 TaxID=1643925 RepID=UPI0007BF6F37|nr:tail fiber protein [Paenibacillus sp. O199]